MFVVSVWAQLGFGSGCCGSGVRPGFYLQGRGEGWLRYKKKW